MKRKLSYLILFLLISTVLIPSISALNVSTVDPTNTMVGSIRYEFQRKSFYANGRFWIFYLTDSRSWFTSTADNGTTWEARTDLRNTAEATFGYKLSVWHDGTNVHYAYGELEAGSYASRYRKGVTNSDGTITWVAVEQVVTGSIGLIHLYSPQIAVSSGGYPWITCIGADSDGHKNPIVKSSDRNDGIWNEDVHTDLTAVEHAQWSSTVVALTDEKMAFFYTYDNTNLNCKTWDGDSWNSATQTTAVVGEATALSVVADGDTVHCVFLVGNNIVYTLYTYSTNSFGTETVIHTGSVDTYSPVITLHKSSGSLVVFWVSDPTPNHIYYRAYEGEREVWLDEVDWIDESSDLLSDYRSLSTPMFIDDTFAQFIFYYIENGGTPYPIKCAWATLNITMVYAESVYIENMEGCGNWVFAEETYYIFNGYYFINTSLNPANLSISFSDGVNTVNATFRWDENGAHSWELESGEDVVTLAKGEYTRAGNYVNVTFPIFFTADILDAYDVDIYSRASDSSGSVTSWSNVAVDYFNIYQAGGRVEYTLVGSSGKTVGGDVWEIWAGGYSPADIYEQYFGGGYLTGEWEKWNPSDNEAGVQSAVHYGSVDIFSGYVYAKTTSVGGAGLIGGFKEQSGTDVFETECYVRTTSNTQGEFTLSYGRINPNTFLYQSAVTIAFGYGADYDYIYASNLTGGWQNTTQGFSADTWYKVEVDVDLGAGTYDLEIDDAGLGTFYLYNVPNVNLIRIFTDYGSSARHGYIDNIVISTAGGGGGYGGSAVATSAFRNLQQVHLLFAIGITDGDTVLSDAGEGYVEWGFDYCIDDTWITNGWKVRIEVLDAKLAGMGLGSQANNWIKINCTWYVHDTTKIKSEVLYSFWEGLSSVGGTSDDADYFRFWIDLWFNKMNASTVIGGRVNSYYYGMHDNANPWFRVLTGSNWGAMAEDASERTFYYDLTDGDGNIISCKQIEMMRLRVKVYRTNDYDYRWVLREYSVFETKDGEPRMVGVNTPTFIETRTANMPSGGLWTVLVSAINSLGKIIANAFISSVIPFLTMIAKWTLTFLDMIFAWTGNPHLVSDILSTALTFVQNLANAVIYLGLTIYRIFLWLPTLFDFFVSYVWAPIAWTFNFIFNPAFNLVDYMTDLFGIVGAWLGGVTYTATYGAFYDFSSLSTMTFGALSGGIAMFGIIGMMYIIFIPVFCASRMSLMPLLAPMMFFYSVLKFLFDIFSFVIKIPIMIIDMLGLASGL